MRKKNIWYAAVPAIVVATLFLTWSIGPRFGIPVSAWQRFVEQKIALLFNAEMPQPGDAPVYTDKPYLMVEVGRHSAPPRSMSRDLQGRLLVTGADDKTIRVWSLPDGSHPDLQPLDVLRPPTDGGEGNVGKVNAVALSPDGRLIAAGGIMTPSSPPDAIYIFDRVSGAMKERIPSPDMTISLAFSPDGRYLVAGTARAGMHVWRTADWQPVASDTDYRNQVRSLVFGKNGWLAAASWDGAIRLYDPQFHRKARVKPVGGKVPSGIAFSPDGGKLAVGFFDSAAVILLDGRTLRGAALLNEVGKDGGKGAWYDQNFQWVSWSADGRYLFAGGSARKPAPYIRCWDIAAAKTPPRDFTSLPLTNTVMALAPYGSSGVLVLAADPLIGAYDEKGNPAFEPVDAVQQSVPRLKTHANDDNFRVSRNGMVVELPSYESYKGNITQKMLRIDLSVRSVTEIEDNDPNLAPPLEVRPGFGISYQDGNVKKLVWPSNIARRLLISSTEEILRATAFAPNGAFIVVGTDKGVRLYSGDGKRSDFVPTPSVIWRVNVTPDGRLVVAIGQDGILRWFRVENGRELRLKELLRLFVNKLDDRWAAWTPTGYYDASAGGEDLIGWQINRRPDQTALFYGASRFRDIFYSPELIRQTLATGNVPLAPPEALSLRNRLPPVVHILGILPSANGNALIRYYVESPTKKLITDFSVMIDGALYGHRGAEDAVVPGKTQTIEVALPAGAPEKQVTLSAGTRDGNSDVVTRAVSPRHTRSAEPEFGDLYALVVGVGKFRDPTIPKLKFAAADAEAIGRALQAQEHRLYRRVYLKVLTAENGKARTRTDVEKGLIWLADSPTGENDVELLYLAGHGIKRPNTVRSKDTNEYLFFVSETERGKDKVGTTSVTSGDIISHFLGENGARRIIFVDTCHAAQLGTLDANGLVNVLRDKTRGAMVLASSEGNQKSWELPQYRHGAFTQALLEAFYGRQGAPHKPNGRITQRKLSDWLDDRVPDLTKDTDQTQTPISLGMDGAAIDIITVIPEQEEKPAN